MRVAFSMRPLCGAILALVLIANPLLAAPLWLPVTHTTKRTGANYYAEIVKTQAEQSTATLEKPDHRKHGDPAPTVLRTRNLQFSCRGKNYAVPDSFSGDLLWLGVDSSVRASINGRDAVFAMIGDSGAKAYTVYFHFRDDRFFQRILDQGEIHNILIRTNDILTGQ